MNKKIILVIVILVSIAGGIVWYIQSNKQQQQKDMVTEDMVKIADLADARTIVGLYYQKYNKFPKSEGNTPEARWQNLDNLFTREYSNLGFTKPWPLPQDYRKGYSYDYQTDSFQQNAVLKAILEAPNDTSVIRAALTNHRVSGIIYGLNCNGSNYCIKFFEQ